MGKAYEERCTGTWLGLYFSFTFMPRGKHLKGRLESQPTENRCQNLKVRGLRKSNLKRESLQIPLSLRKGLGMHQNSTHLNSHKLVRGWSGSDWAGLHVLVSLLADWLSSACLNIRMELQILRAGPSLTLIIFTMSRWVRRRNALPSICQRRKGKKKKPSSMGYSVCKKKYQYIQRDRKSVLYLPL